MEGYENKDFYTINLEDLDSAAKNTVRQFLQNFQILGDLGKLSLNDMYVVDFPQEVLDKLATGDFWIHSKKDGSILPDLMRVNDQGKSVIASRLTCSKWQIFDEAAVSNLKNKIAIASLNRAVNSLQISVNELTQIAVRIERGQHEDRVALIRSGMKDIQNALLLKDEGSRLQQIINGRSKISNGLDGLLGELKVKCMEFEPISKFYLGRTFQIFAKRKLTYADEKANEFQQIQDLYLECNYAAEILSKSYLLTGDKQAAENCLLQTWETFDSIDTTNIRTIENYHSPENNRLFYRNYKDDLPIVAERVASIPTNYSGLRLEGTGKTIEEFIDYE